MIICDYFGTVFRQLAAVYSPLKITCVERLSPGVYRATLADGRIVGAFATDSGTVKIKEMDCDA